MKIVCHGSHVNVRIALNALRKMCMKNPRKKLIFFNVTALLINFTLLGCTMYTVCVEVVPQTDVHIYINIPYQLVRFVLKRWRHQLVCADF